MQTDLLLFETGSNAIPQQTAQLTRLLAAHQRDAGVRILAYCLMTNHVHLVVVPERADSLAVLFRRVHGSYAQALNTRRGREPETVPDVSRLDCF